MPNDDRPVLAVLHESWSVSAFDIANAANGWCRLVWVVGWCEERERLPDRFLNRLGTVVDMSASDRTTTLHRLKELGVGGFVGFTDRGQPIAAELAASLAVFQNSVETALLLNDKFLQREALQAAGLPGPAFALIGPGDSARPGTEAAMSHVGFPAVLKPRHGTGARDTSFVTSPDELGAALQAVDPALEFVLEEYLEDESPRPWSFSDVLSVETITAGGVFHHLVTTGRFPFAPPFMETGLFMPSHLTPERAEEAKELAGAALAALGYAVGVSHTEIKLTPAGMRLVEVNGRLGGGVHRMLAGLDGPPILTWAMRVALGMLIHTPAPLPPQPVSFVRWRMPPFDATRLVSVSGLKEAEVLPGVDRIELIRHPGPISWREGDLARVAAITGVAPSHSALLDLIVDLDATLKIQYATE